MQLEIQRSTRSHEVDRDFFDRRPQLLLVVLVLIFVAAGSARLYRLDAPGVLVDRDYTSAILTRNLLFKQIDTVPAWRVEVAEAIQSNQTILEPPITEGVVTILFWMLGREDLRIARLLTSAFWLAGGVFLFQLARTLVSVDAAVAATVYYLFAPMSILVSRSFQPDSLMMLMFLASLLWIVRYFQEPSDRKLLLASALSAATLVHRPLVLFALLAAFAALSISERGWRTGLLNRRVTIFSVLSAAPAVLYYGSAIFLTRSMSEKMDATFAPHLFLERAFWSGWFQLAVSGVGYSVLLTALIGIPLLRSGKARAIVVGALVGYVPFGLLFTMHIHTHGYYHAQLIPILALPLGVVASVVWSNLRNLCRSWQSWIPVTAALALIMYSGFRTVRARLNPPSFESPEVASRIGEIVQHSKRVVFLAPFYGYPLQYHAELAGAYWPRRITYWLYRRQGEKELSVQERLAALGFTPEYFVITAFGEYERHHTDLAAYLHSHCAPLAEGEQFQVYGKCVPRQPMLVASDS